MQFFNYFLFKNSETAYIEIRIICFIKVRR